jgi:hypothetical protein
MGNQFLIHAAYVLPASPLPSAHSLSLRAPAASTYPRLLPVDGDKRPYPAPCVTITSNSMY